jgi:hypothetical protein
MIFAKERLGITRKVLKKDLLKETSELIGRF